MLSTAFKPPRQPSLTGWQFWRQLAHLPRDSRDTLFLLLVIAWTLLPHTGVLPLWCSVLAGSVLLWRGWLAWHSKPLPGKAWPIGLLLVAVGLTWFTQGALMGRDASVTLLVVLLSLKTLELRARRDAFVVFFLGFFTMVTHFFYSQSLLVGASMLIGLLGLLTALVNAHMPVGRPSLLAATGIAGRMALLGAPIMLVLFMLFPRIGPLWGMPSDAMTGRSSLKDRMEVGNIAKAALDSSVAMRVKFEGQPPARSALYFRGPVLSVFDGRTWTARSPFPLRNEVPAALQVRGLPIQYEVTLEPTYESWLLVLDAAVDAPQLPPGIRGSMQSDLQWRTRRPITDLLRYQATSYPMFRHGSLQASPALREFVELPAGFNPRTLAWAADIRRDPRYAQADARTLVPMLLERLQTGGYRYTLEPGLNGQHTADEFWFDSKQGFCEHIASAFVVLMRALDIPARIVTGYQGGEINNVDGFWMVRQSDAHAWAEVWVPGLGWSRVDPTAAVSPERVSNLSRLPPPASPVSEALGKINPNVVLGLRALWEAVNNRWNQSVLNYTQNRQFNFLKDLGFDTPSWEDLAKVLLIIIVLVTLAGAAWTLWERTQHDPWLRLLDRAKQRLAGMGIASSAATSPRQLAAQVSSAAHSPLAAPARQALYDWLIALEQARYANSPDSLRQQLAGLRQAFKRLVWAA